MQILDQVTVSASRWRCDFNVYRKQDASTIETKNVIYMFLEVLRNNNYQVHYIGKTTGKACERLSNHERWDEAARLGCTRIAVCCLKDCAPHIDDIEAALIEKYQPTLNTQHC